MIVVLRADYDAVRFTAVCVAPRTSWTSESRHSLDQLGRILDRVFHHQLC
ncbi:MAG: hypothetical protein WA755_07095 [Candidatus Acidiferrales bacterium]